MQFFSLDDARMRLGGSIIQYEDHFFFVREVGFFAVSRDEDGDWIPDVEEPDDEVEGCLVSPLDNKHYDCVIEFGRGSDIFPFKQPLGYVNLEQDDNYDKAMLYHRYPVSQTRIGLTGRNSGWFGGGPSFNSGFRFDPGFMKMLRNQYPPLAEARATMRKMAFARDFAVEPVTLSSSTILYREEQVGEVNDKGIILYPNGHYLKECLEANPNVGVNIELFEA